MSAISFSPSHPSGPHFCFRGVRMEFSATPIAEFLKRFRASIACCNRQVAPMLSAQDATFKSAALLLSGLHRWNTPISEAKFAPRLLGMPLSGVCFCYFYSGFLRHNSSHEGSRSLASHRRALSPAGKRLSYFCFGFGRVLPRVATRAFTAITQIKTLRRERSIGSDERTLHSNAFALIGRFIHKIDPERRAAIFFQCAHQRRSRIGLSLGGCQMCRPAPSQRHLGKTEITATSIYMGDPVNKRRIVLTRRKAHRGVYHG